MVEHKLPVMNRAFFSVRGVFYVGFWTFVGECLRRWSLKMDRPDPPDHKTRLRKFSSALLPLVGITGTFAAFDWLMSLSPVFYSTMYGLYVLAGGFVASIGLLALLLYLAQERGYLVELGRSHWYAIGRLLFAFLVFWAYTGYFQYMIIWIGNKPIEVIYYLDRFRPGERWATWFLIVGHFVVPWLILLLYWVKRHRGTVALLGGWLLASHYVDVHWLVGPLRSGEGWRWQEAPALAAIGGLCVAFALWRQRGKLLAPVHDPDYPRGVAYESR
jgi:hypothetical protein